MLAHLCVKASAAERCRSRYGPAARADRHMATGVVPGPGHGGQPGHPLGQRRVRHDQFRVGPGQFLHLAEQPPDERDQLTTRQLGEGGREPSAARRRSGHRVGRPAGAPGRRDLPIRVAAHVAGFVAVGHARLLDPGVRVHMRLRGGARQLAQARAFLVAPGEPGRAPVDPALLDERVDVGGRAGRGGPSRAAPPNAGRVQQGPDLLREAGGDQRRVTRQSSSSSSGHPGSGDICRRRMR